MYGGGSKRPPRFLPTSFRAMLPRWKLAHSFHLDQCHTPKTAPVAHMETKPEPVPVEYELVWRTPLGKSSGSSASPPPHLDVTVDQPQSGSVPIVGYPCDSARSQINLARSIWISRLRAARNAAPATLRVGECRGIDIRLRRQARASARRGEPACQRQFFSFDVWPMPGFIAFVGSRER